ERGSRYETAMSGEHARRTPASVPFNVFDDLVHHLDAPTDPWSIQVEVRVAGTFDEARLRSALGTALARHSLVRARQRPSTRWQQRLIWEITPEPDLDPLLVVECPDADALAALRTTFYSCSVPLDESPPLRMRLARDPRGDLLMVNVNHAATDGLGSIRFL